MSEYKLVPVELIKFLLGEGEFDGMEFGDRGPGQKSFWWRSRLREAIAAAPAPEQQAEQAQRPVSIPEDWKPSPVVTTRMVDRVYPADLVAASPRPVEQQVEQSGKCQSCNGQGVIGWTTGQTPESFDQGDRPYPECQADDYTAPPAAPDVSGLVYALM
ncbi:hypothetical protein SAMN05216198_1521 [Halopseudomonas litoralis]|uniref:Uncharacterized protein n=1 Tax=Halopseudomonas litoralis TaxID=797277 RepID=A0A1H1QLR7_9GAMM|nr:hypothetical protein [Halopseudomonas litoralis]SDS24345.1 hypothetical protein SAMN05216198_1521 [Halopseudomonas litoralis]